ncbi:MAG: zeta toxin family protein [Cyclobacteriaceae bacterium]|nr:zeta toxin family protein [Cyclobacteriaceae bacterium]
MPNLYIIGGCNGAGKTTAAYTVLPEMLNCREFVNADEIARGISPFQPERVSFQAGRIMLNRIKELIEEGVDFAFETTLSTKSYTTVIKTALSKGYKVTLIFFWLESPELAKERVKFRVANGGHNIPDDIIVRRYFRGLKNFFTLYLRLTHTWLVYDNSASLPELIARGEDDDFVVINNDIWKRLSHEHTVSGSK